MNTNHPRAACGIALATVALTMVTACGSETAAPARVSDGFTASPAPRSPCFGSADYAERACADDGGPGAGPRASGSGFGPQ